MTGGVAPQDETLAAAGGTHDVERPRLARGATREPDQPLDAEIRLARLPLEVGDEAFGELTNVRRRGRHAQRGNASGTPPSTGNVAPVVGVRLAAKKTTALPTCSPVTRVLRRFLWR